MRWQREIEKEIEGASDLSTLINEWIKRTNEFRMNGVQSISTTNNLIATPPHVSKESYVNDAAPIKILERNKRIAKHEIIW